MDSVKSALKSQYHASLAMLRGAIEMCPDAMWENGTPPRQFWRLAYHTLFFTHLYLERTAEEFEAWSKHRDEVESDQERERLDAAPYTRGEMIEYLELVDARVDSQLDLIDLSSPESGIHWYKMPKLDHQIVNIRHVQEHAGQLRDRLLESGFDPKWIGKVQPSANIT